MNGVTAVSADDVLSNSSPSAMVLSGSTTAVLWSDVTCCGALALIVIVLDVPLMIAPLMQLTTPEFWLHVNAAPGPTPASAAETNTSPTGSTSRTVTFNAGSVPVLPICRL